MPVQFVVYQKWISKINIFICERVRFSKWTGLPLSTIFVFHLLFWRIVRLSFGETHLSCQAGRVYTREFLTRSNCLRLLAPELDCLPLIKAFTSSETETNSTRKRQGAREMFYLLFIVLPPIETKPSLLQEGENSVAKTVGNEGAVDIPSSFPGILSLYLLTVKSFTTCIRNACSFVARKKKNEWVDQWWNR